MGKDGLCGSHIGICNTGWARFFWPCRSPWWRRII